MFLVVFQHLYLWSFKIPTYESVLAHIFITFRMPMFFFISGYIGYKAIEYWNKSFFINRLSKKAIVQLVPTIIFFSTYYICFGGNPISFFTYGLGAYWFTLVLFEMFLIYFIISYISNTYTKWGGKIFDLLLILTTLLGLFAYDTYRDYTYKIWDILSLSNLTYFLQFFTLGIFCKRYNYIFIKFITNNIIIALSTISFIIIMILIHQTGGVSAIKGNFGLIGIFTHDIAERYLGLFIVFAFFYKNRNFFEKDNLFNKCITFTGRRTLDIYLIHYFLIPNLPFFKPLLEANQNVVLELFIPGIMTALVVSVCLMISSILRNSEFLAHYLFGAKSDKYKY